jgi:predicted RNase H-like HicB family nuclease
MTLKYPVILIQDKESGGFTTHLYDIPAALAQGDTREEAKYEVVLALEDILGDNYFEQGRSVPLPSCIKDITLEEIKEDFPWLDLDSDAKDYLDCVELSEDESQKVLRHNEKICQSVA